MSDQAQPPSRIREAVRALVVDRDQQILLVHFDWDGLDMPGGFWATPGGGIEPGETHTEALRRELREEVGLQVEEIGHPVWRKTHVFDMNGWDGQTDHFYLVRVEHFEPQPAMTAEQLRAENVHGIRWWSQDELAAGEVTFSPRRLATYLTDLLRDGPGEEPRELDPL